MSVYHCLLLYVVFLYVFISLRLFVISTDINKTYDDFMDKLTKAINEVAPIKNVRVKGSNQDWFDNQIHDAIKKRDKLFCNFKKTKLHDDRIKYT